METRPEDAMDLGGFLENYVLSNPFSHRTLSPKGDNNQQSHNSSKSTSLQLSNSASKSLNGGTSPNQSTDVASQTEASKCGHVGSNRSFAESLKEQKVANAHKALKDWLLSQYRCVSSLPVLLRGIDLLKKAQNKFPQVTSVVLSRTMQFTFPDCRKVVNKRGTFWQGLVDIEDGESIDTTTLTLSPGSQGESCTQEVKDLLRSKLRSSEWQTEIKLEECVDLEHPSSDLSISPRKLYKQKRKRSLPRRKSKSPYTDVQNNLDDTVDNSNRLKQELSDEEYSDQISHFSGQFTDDLYDKSDLDAITDPCGEREYELPITANKASTMPVPVSEIKKETPDMGSECIQNQATCGSSENVSCDKTVSNNETTIFSSSRMSDSTTKTLELENENLTQNCRDLQEALVSSHTRVRSLTEQLSRKDMELAELADEFFELSRGFHRLSQRFHCVLQGSVNSAEKSPKSSSS